MTAWQALRYGYWAARRGPPTLAHLLRAVAGALASAARLRLHRRKTLAIALIEHFGDIAAAEPVARHARATHPGHRVLWIARPPFAELAAAPPAVDAVVTVTCLTEWLLLWRWARFDVVWDLHPNFRQCPRCCVPLQKSSAGVLPGQQDFLRFGALLAMQCRAAGLPPLADAPRLALPAAAARAVDLLALPGKFVAIHCRSNDPLRDWDDARWPALVARILAMWDGAVVEVGLHPVAIQADGPRLRSLCGRLPILHSAEAIRRASLFVGIDSGPAHLANAVGTSAVILLGGLGGVSRYVPFNGFFAAGGATLLHADGSAATLPLDTVAAAVAARLPP